MRLPRLFWTVLLLSLQNAVAAAAPAAIELESMTWTDVQAAIRAGDTAVIIPAGGTEQNGPHMALGKHNVRVRALASKIAIRLGGTLVAPVVAYVPEGNVAPPAGHMRFAGTLSVSPEAFAAIIEGAARSLKQHGFKDILLLGDHGGYQPQLKAIAAKLNREWSGGAAKAYFVGEYYQSTQVDYLNVLRTKGLSDFEIGTHAASADTSLMLAIDPALVHLDRLESAARTGPAAGTVGDPRKASVELGNMGVDLVVSRSVQSIKAWQAHR